MRRIIPLAVIVLVVTVYLASDQPSPQQAAGVRTDAWWCAIFLSNWHFAASGTDYFNLAAAPSPLQHYWSLSIEEQFYLVWPWLLGAVGLAALGRKVGIRAVAFLLAASAAVVSLAFGWWQTSASPTAAYFSTFGRIWELALGAVLAAMAPAFRRWSLPLQRIVAWTGLTSITLSCLLIGETSGIPVPGAILAVVGSGALLAAGVAPGAHLPAALTARPLTWLGDISYGLYLWHFPVIVFLRLHLTNAFALSVAVLASTLALATCTYYLVENPLMHLPGARSPGGWKAWRQRYLRPVVPALVVALVTALGVNALLGTPFANLAVATADPADVGSGAGDEAAVAPSPTPSESVAAGTDRGIPGVPPMTATGQKIQQGLTNGAGAESWAGVIDPATGKSLSPDGYQAPYAACNATVVSDPASCSFGPSDADEVVVVGDSIAGNRMYAAVAGLAKDHHVRGLIHTSCSILDIGVTYPTKTWAAPCAKLRRESIDYIKTHRPQTVLFTQSLTWAGRLTSGARGSAATAEWVAAERAYFEQIRRYVGSIVVLSPAPVTGNPSTCYRKNGSPQACTTGISAFYESMSKAQAAVPDVTYVDTRDWFCTVDGRCPVLTDLGGETISFRRDAAHTTPHYDVMLGRSLREILTPAEAL